MKDIFKPKRNAKITREFDIILNVRKTSKFGCKILTELSPKNMEPIISRNKNRNLLLKI